MTREVEMELRRLRLLSLRLAHALVLYGDYFDQWDGHEPPAGAMTQLEFNQAMEEARKVVEDG